MTLEDAIVYLYILLGIICIFRPFLYLFLLVTLPVLASMPTPAEDAGGFRVLEAGSVNIYVQDYLILLMVFLLARLSIQSLRSEPGSIGNIVRMPLTKGVFLLILWDVLIAVASYSKGFGVQSVLRKLSTDSYMLLCILIPLMNCNRGAISKILKYTIFLGFVLILTGSYKYFVTGEIIVTSSGTIRSLDAHVAGFLIVPICVILFYWDCCRGNKFIQLFLFVFLSIGIAFTGHRSGWVVLFIILFVFFIAEIKKDIKVAWVPMSLISFVLISCLISTTVSFKPGQSLYGDTLIRISDIFDFNNHTTKGRVDKWMLSIDTVRKNPILGLGRFPVHTNWIDSDNNDHLLVFDELDRSTHNIFFQKIIHEGIIGLLILLSFLFVVFREINRGDWDRAGMVMFLNVSIASALVLSQFSTFFYSATGKICLFLLLGILNTKKLQDFKMKG